MNDATRAQGVQHLKLIEDQGLDRKESEALNLYLPALAESVKKRKIPPVPEFRKLVGLSILELLMLARSIPALTEQFDPSDKFTVDTSDTAVVKISYCGKNFSLWMLTAAVEARAAYELEVHSLTEDARDTDILQGAARDDVDTDIAAIHYLVSQQPKGENGPLMNNGRANIFYVPRKVEEQGKIRAVRRVVRVFWLVGGWHFSAHAVPNPYGWYAGHRVFLRKRLDTVSV